MTNGSVTERMRIDSSGNVGIGVTPSRALHVNSGASNVVATFESTDGVGAIELKDSSGTCELSTSSGGFNVQPNGGASALTVDNSGNVLVGTSSTPSATQAGFLFTSDQLYTSAGANTAYNYQVRFYNGNGLVGHIATNGSSTSYNTSSDYRLKEDVQPVANASDRLMQLNPVNFAWKSDGSRVDGFLAHEAQEVVPEAVSGEKDAMTTEEYEVTPAVEATYDEDGNELTPAVEAVMGEREVEDYQGIDQSKLVPLLTAALQEALARIEALENK
jgi:hypothetical protein